MSITDYNESDDFPFNDRWKGGKDQECLSAADCPNGYQCNQGKCEPVVSVNQCMSDADCPNGYKCINGNCIKLVPEDEEDTGNGDGTGNGVSQTFGWSSDLQGLLSRFNERIQYLLDNPTGTTPEERQAIINFAKKGILRGERGALQSTTDTLSRQGLLGTPYAGAALGEVRRGTQESIADLQYQTLIDELDRKYQQTVGTSALVDKLLGTSMESEKLVEILNAARRGEGQTALNSFLSYFNTLYGGQSDDYWSSIIQALLSGMS